MAQITSFQWQQDFFQLDNWHKNLIFMRLLDSKSSCVISTDSSSHQLSLNKSQDFECWVSRQEGRLSSRGRSPYNNLLCPNLTFYCFNQSIGNVEIYTKKWFCLMTIYSILLSVSSDKLYSFYVILCFNLTRNYKMKPGWH